MKEENKTKQQLVNELATLRQRVDELEAAQAEHAQMERAWHKSESLLHSLVQSLPQNVYSKDLQGRFTFANQHYCQTAGRALQDILGKTDLDLHPPELAQKYREDDQRVVASQQIMEIVEEHQPLDGESIYVQVIKTPLYDAQGQTTGTLGIFWDITARQRAEEALRKSEERYRQSVENSPNSIFSIDRQGLVQTWNQACELAFQYARKDILGQAYHTLLWNPQERPAVEAMLEQVWQGRSLRDQDISYRSQAGMRRFMAVLLYPVYDDEGRIRECLLVNTDVTEQVRMKEALRQSETRFRELAEMLPDMIYETNAELNLTYVNRAFCEALGYTEQELIRDVQTTQLMDEKSMQRGLQNVTAIIQGQPPKADVYQLRRKDGSTFPGETTATPIRDSEGNFVGMRGVVRDITARMQAEAQREAMLKALQESEARYRILFENADDAIFIVQQERFVDCNPKTLEMFGCSREQIIGQSPFRFSPPLQPDGRDSREQAREKIQLALNGNPQSFERLHIRYDGTPFHAAVSLNLMELPGEVFLQAVVRDITQRKRAEAQRDATLQALQRRNHELSTLYKAAMALNADLSLDAVLQTVVQQIVQALDLDGCALSLWKREEDLIETLVDYDVVDPHDTIPGGSIYQLDDYPATRRVLETGQSVLIQHDDPQADATELALMEQWGTLTLLMLPLVVRDRVVGLVELIDRTQARDYTPEEIRLAQSLTAQAAVAIENARMYQEIQQELSERKLAEAQRDATLAALRESEERYRLHFEHVSDVIYSIGPEFTTLSVSPSVVSLLGYRPEELLGKPFPELNLLAPEYLEAALSDMIRILMGERISATYEFIHKDGSRKFGEVSGAPLMRDGQVVAIVAVARDITQRVRAERLLQALNQAALAMGQAQTPEDIFVAVAEELVKLGFFCTVFLTDESQRKLILQYFNYKPSVLKAAEKLTGLKAERFAIPIDATETYKKAVWERESAFVADAKDFIRQVLPRPARMFAGQITKILQVPQFILAPLVVDDKVIGLFSVQSEDLSANDAPAITAFAHQMAAVWRKARLVEDLEKSLGEQKRAEKALLQRTVELQARNEELDSFAHTVAHDLKGPLGLIVGLTGVLEEDYDQVLSEDTRKVLRTVSWNGRKMGNIIDELLLLAGVRQMRQVERTPLDMAHSVGEALERMSYMVKRYQAQVILPEAWPTALGYGPWIEEVWVNYLSNALKYGGRPPRIELGVGGSANQRIGESANQRIGESALTRRLADSQTRFWVRDNGPGLTAEEQGRLFRSFERLDRVRAKGHGLGLAIVRRIVEKLGGQVGVESEVGVGSVFWFTLPAQK